MRKVLLLSAILLSISASFGQMEYKRFSFDVNGGLPFVYGDITNKTGGYNVTGRFNYNITRSFAFGVEFSSGRVQGLNKDSEKFYFTNQYMKGFVGVQMYFFNLFHFYELAKWFQPYVSANVGLIKSNIKDSGSERYGVINEHYKGWDFGSQFSLGAKFKLSKFLDFNTNFSIANMKTDKFDNHVPRFFVNNYNDVLSTAEIGLTLHLGGKGKEPIIWSAPPCCLIPESNFEQDTLAAKLAQLEEKINDNLEDVDSLKASNLSLNNKIDSIQNSMALSLEECCNKNNSNPYIGGKEGFIYEAELEGPVEAEYYIVSGSYAVLDNANNRIKVLSDAGYTAYIMREPVVGLNRVVIFHTDIYKEALDQVAKYRYDLDPKAWIIKKAKK